MNIQNGSILISSLLLNDDPYFGKSVILIAEHNEKGTIGFVINKLSDRKFNELIEFNHSKPFPLYAGGPVETESLFFLHRRPDIIDGGILITDSLCMSGNFKQVVELMNDRIITEDDIKLFIGYSGWDSGQLDAEIKEGSWLSVDTPVQSIFSIHHNNFFWEELFERKTLLSLN